jgi:hypothetical protein
LVSDPNNTSNGNLATLPNNAGPLWNLNADRGSHAASNTGASLNGPGLGLATDKGWFDNGSGGHTWGLTGFDSTNAYDNRSTFWLIAQASSNTSAPGSENPFGVDLDGDGVIEVDNNGEDVAGGDLEFAYFQLTRLGQLTLVNPAPAVVPVPAAVWLLGSGLLGLVGVARRKSAQA